MGWLSPGDIVNTISHTTATRVLHLLLARPTRVLDEEPDQRCLALVDYVIASGEHADTTGLGVRFSWALAVLKCATWAGREALVQPLGGDIPRHPLEAGFPASSRIQGPSRA